MKITVPTITTTFEQNGKVILKTTAELALKGRYLGTIRNVQVFHSVRLLDKHDRRCGKDFTTAGFGSFSVIQRDEATGKILQVVAVSTKETLARMPGATIAVH